MVITKFEYSRAKKELEEDRKLLPQAIQDKRAALELGDYSENSELDAAKKKLNDLKYRISKNEEIMKATIIDQDVSPLIVPGSFVKIKYLKSGTSVERILLISESGDSLIDGILSTKSELGRLIQGRESGDYTVGNNTFHVEKLTDFDSYEFFSMYGDRKDRIESLLGEE
jgi:transcription elongation GreA/GreB family factor